MHCDLARGATIVGWINAAAQIGGAISGKFGAENVQLGSGIPRNAMASTEAVASSSAARPRHWRATNSAPFLRTSRADAETDRGLSSTAAEPPVTSVGADIGASLGLTIGSTVRAAEASGCTTTVAKRPALMASLGPRAGAFRADFVLDSVAATTTRNAADVTSICGASAAR